MTLASGSGGWPAGRKQRQVAGQVSALTTGTQPAGSERSRPLQLPRGEVKPGQRVGLDDVRWRTAGVAGAWNALDSGKRRNAYLDRPSRYRLGKQLQAVPNSGTQCGPLRLGARSPGREHGSQARRAEHPLGNQAGPRRLAISRSLLVDSGKQPTEVRTARWHGSAG
jgi:hypothetical protein